MNTSRTMQELISAFADGELDEARHPEVLALLDTPDGRAAWDELHLSGDILRSDDMALRMSGDFAAGVSARLESEPVFLAPPAALGNRLRRLAMPGAAVAAAVVLTVLTVPHLAGLAPGATPAAKPEVAALAVVTGAPDVLRDARIDEYLLAHQRFSPSVYSTAQFARSATFATESGK